MADTYDKIFRQVALRANQLNAVDAAALATAYSVATIGQTQMADRAIEFPEVAIQDAILNAGDQLVSAIGEDKNSHYRTFFHNVTGNLSSGTLIPLTSADNKSRVGVIGEVRDFTILRTILLVDIIFGVSSSSFSAPAGTGNFTSADLGRTITDSNGNSLGVITAIIDADNVVTDYTIQDGEPQANVTINILNTNERLVSKTYPAVIGATKLTTLKQTPFWYFTDNVRIWHTRGFVVCDIVVWDKADQRILLNSTPNRGACPFPEDLHEALVCGALSYIFRASFNVEQVQIWRGYFLQTLEKISGRKMMAETIERQELV